MTNTSYTPWASMPMQRGAHLGARVYATDTEVLIAEIYDAKHGPMIAAAPEMAEALSSLIGAVDANALEMNSQEIDINDSDIPPHPWHEEWLYHARAILAKIKGE